MNTNYKALATDYDDTLAARGVAPPLVVESLKKLRRAGFHLLLVTGRELPELQAIFPHLDLFQRVVAENGAVLYRPVTREKVLLAAPPDPVFKQTLRERRVAFQETGDVVVAAYRQWEDPIREVIRELDLDLHIIVNKDSVMALPPGIDKGSGLEVALNELNLQPEEVVAVGDAENDFALLEHCGFPVAVANALPELKARARFVTKSERGAGVAELINLLLEAHEERLTGGSAATSTPR